MEGERNTRFYLMVAKGKAVRNRIRKIRNEEGQWLDTEEDIATRVVDFFSQLYTS